MNNGARSASFSDSILFLNLAMSLDWSSAGYRLIQVMETYLSLNNFINVSDEALDLLKGGPECLASPSIGKLITFTLRSSGAPYTSHISLNASKWRGQFCVGFPLNNPFLISGMRYWSTFPLLYFLQCNSALYLFPFCFSCCCYCMVCCVIFCCILMDCYNCC